MIANVTETREEFEIFNYKNLGSVRTYLDEKGEPWFCLKDVCDVLGLTDTNKVASRLEEGGTNSIRVGVQTGVRRDGTPAFQEVPMTFIDEGNLYEAIGRSRKPEAKLFMRWVYREVLPNLRKAGQQRRYNNTNGISYSELDNRITRIEDILSEVTKFNDKLETAYKYSAVFSLSDREGRKNFINYLKEKGVLNNFLVPTESYISNGTFIVETYNRDKYTGIIGLEKIKFLSTITDYGLDYFKDELIKDGYREENIDLDSGGEGIESEWCKIRTEK